MIEYISASDHYKRVLTLCSQVKHILWIGTADIKDLYIEMGKQKIPFLGLLAKLIKQDVSVRLIHAKEPGPAFREDFDKYPVLFDGLERVLCPRVHFKMIIFDCEMVYIGSANLTGAGMGMKTTVTSKLAFSPMIQQLLNRRWTSSTVSGMGLCARSVDENNTALTRFQIFDYSKSS